MTWPKVLRLLALAALVSYAARVGVLGWIFCALLVLLARLILVRFREFKDCFWCKGKGRRRRRHRTGDHDVSYRPGPVCWRCRGHRQLRRIGAKQVAQLELYLRKCWRERSWKVTHR